MQINRTTSIAFNVILFLSVVGLGYGLTLYFDGLHPSYYSPEITAGDNEVVQDFSFTDLSGQTHTLNDFKGKIILINMWATWCTPCVVEFPALIKFAAANKDKVVLIALSSDMAETDIRRFLAKQAEPGDNVYIALDRDNITLKNFGVSQLPETVITDRELKKKQKLIGADWEPEELQKIIDSL
jgi:thiol-disulfide isomerase/thioredoxin